MKVSNLHRQQQFDAAKMIQKDRTAEAKFTVDVSAQVAKARASLVLSRGTFAARAAKARKSLPKRPDGVLLG